MRLPWICHLRFATVLGVVALCLSAFGTSLAAPVNYGDFAGTNFQFQGVTENSLTDPPPLYEAPIVTGDSLVFTPTAFGAFAENGAVDMTDGLLTMKIAASDGVGIVGITLEEFGDWSFAGGGIATQAWAAAPVFVTIVEVDKVSIDPITVVAQSTFTPSGGSFNSQDDADNGSWTGGMTLNLGGALANRGIDGVATRVILTMDNTLVALSEVNSSALINKKGLNLSVDAVGVQLPEPSSLALVAMGLIGCCGVGWRRWRKRTPTA